MLNYLKKKFYKYVPVHLQQRLKTASVAAVGRLCLLIPVYRIEQAGLVVTFIGRGSYDAYLSQLMYGEGPVDCRKLGVTAVWNINKAIRKWQVQSDLVVFRDPGFQPSGEMARDMFNLPYYVDQLTSLPPEDSDLLAAFRDPSTVSNLHKIQKAGYGYYISSDLKELEFFYNSMYKPYILSRHRDVAKVPSWSAFRHLREDMELMLITKEGTPVAGAINFQCGDSYMGYANGVLNADPLLLKAGVLSAIYWFGIVEAHRRGCQTFNLGSSRPFLKNGVLAYKKKWNGHVAIDDNSSEFRLFTNGSKAAQRFFEATPFICRHNNQLLSLVFLGEHVQLDDKGLSSYLRACLLQGEQLSTWIILLSEDWSARKESIQTICRGATRTPRIIDFTQKTLDELPDLIRQSTELQQQFDSLANRKVRVPSITKQ